MPRRSTRLRSAALRAPACGRWCKSTTVALLAAAAARCAAEDGLTGPREGPVAREPAADDDAAAAEQHDGARRRSEPPWPAWDAAAPPREEGAADEALDAGLAPPRPDASAGVAPRDADRDGLVDARPGSASDVRAVAVDAPPPCAPLLRINELSTGEAGEGGAAREFVELYNAGACTVDLYGWSLRYLTSTGGSGRLLWSGAGEQLAPGAFLLVASEALHTRARAEGQGARAATWATLRGTTASAGVLSGLGGAVALFAPGGSEPSAAHDALGYATAPSHPYLRGAPAPAPSPGRSLGRLPDGHHRGDNREDFGVLELPSPASPNG